MVFALVPALSSLYDGLKNVRQNKHLLPHTDFSQSFIAASETKLKQKLIPETGCSGKDSIDLGLKSH